MHRPGLIGGTERVARLLIKSLPGKYRQLLVYPGWTESTWCDFEQRDSDYCRELMLNRRWIEAATRLVGCAADLSCAQTESALAKVLRGSKARLVHFHHLLHWDPLLLCHLARRLGLRVVLSLHDFFANCPVYNQLEYASGEPCGIARCGADARCRSCLASYARDGEMPATVEQFMTARHPLAEQMLNQADAIVVPSKFLKDRTIRAFPALLEDRLHIIPHGIEVHERPSRDRQRNDRTVLGYFGGDDRYKGANLLLQIAERLDGCPVEIRIFGRKRGFPADLPGNIKLHGFYHPRDLDALFADIDLTLAPSFYEESFSMIASESWARGVPVMGSNRGALAERVDEGISGWTVRSQSATAWAEKIQNCISNGDLEQVTDHLDRSAVATPKQSAGAYCELYRKILSDSNPCLQDNALRTTAAPSEFGRMLRRFRSRRVESGSRWLQNGPRSNPVLLGIMRNSWATPQYRIRLPLESLKRASACTTVHFHYLEASGLDDVVEKLQETGASHLLIPPLLTDAGLNLMETLSRLPELQIVLIVDDLWTELPPGNPLRHRLPNDVADRLAYLAALSHRIVLTTAELQSRLAFEHPWVQVVKNALEAQSWTGLTGAKNSGSSRLRIGWAGAPQHGADLELLESVIRRTRHLADWVLLGMCPERLPSQVAEVRELAPFQQFPEALADAGLDLAVAPLIDNPFNRCKSNLKLLEYGALSLPVVASDVGPYQHCPVKLIKHNDPDQWVNEIVALLNSQNQRRALGQRLNHWVMENHLDQHRVGDWQRALGLIDEHE